MLWHKGMEVVHSGLWDAAYTNCSQRTDVNIYLYLSMFKRLMQQQTHTIGGWSACDVVNSFVLTDKLVGHIKGIIFWILP